MSIARQIRLCGGVLCGLALGLLAVSPARAALTHDYELEGTYADSLGGPSLVPNSGTLSANGYTFGADQGLTLSSALSDAATYSIDLSFLFNETSGYRRIIDFKDRTTDTGFYNLSTALNFFNETTGPAGAMADDVMARVVLTRDGSSDLVTAYANGVAQFSFTDSTGLAIFNAANNIINFFQDDLAVPGEASPGFVNQIRIYDTALTASEVLDLGGPKPVGGVVPEPASLALVGTGLIGMLGYGLRRRMKTSV